MTNDEIIHYYDYLIRLATSKCNSQSDAEDLVNDTLLAYFACINRGVTVEYPKTWLANTFYHKYNDTLRKKYRSPVTVCLDESFDTADVPDVEYFNSEKASRVRKELNHLGFITREVLIRFYFGNQSVADIAKGLSISEGTVKSRLSAGRGQMKKGLETMETEYEIKENHLPGQLYLSFGGSSGLKNEPVSLVEDDLIAQNLLILAYEKPLSINELSKAIAIPAAYIEPIVKKLVDGELMAETDGRKVYTDFLITKPQDALKNFRPQLDFAHDHFETVWKIIERMSERISDMPFVCAMEKEEKTKLDRYGVLKALQDFQYFCTGRIKSPVFPKRKDGGRWLAHATAFDAGYNVNEYNEASEYTIYGGHRTTEFFAEGGAKRIRLCEFDTTLWDSPHRYGFSYELYFKNIIRLLWCIYTDTPLEKSNIPNEMLSHIPTLEELGMIGNKHNKRAVSIPVLKETEYMELCEVIKCATEEMKTAVGAEFADFIASMKSPIPKHLTSVPELFRYGDATNYFVMAIVREAYEKGLHISGVDYCCPPAVLIYSY